jgi:hypothetical protein
MDPSWWNGYWSRHVEFRVAGLIIVALVFYFRRRFGWPGLKISVAPLDPDLSPPVPPARIDSSTDAMQAVCAALGLGAEWSADPTTPLGVLLEQTPVTPEQLRQRLLSLYGKDVGAIDARTLTGSIANAIYLSRANQPA